MVRPTPSATSAGSRSSSTPMPACSISSATTSRCSSSVTASSSPISSTPPNRSRIARSPRPRRRTPRSGTSCRSIPESPHMLMWAMSDRAIPRSYRMMEGFGVHTFRLVNAEGDFVPRQVPLEAGARCARTGVGGGVDAERCRPRLPPPRPVQRDRRRGVPRVGAGRAGDARQRRPVLQRDRPARLDQAGSRGARTGAARSAG